MRQDFEDCHRYVCDVPGCEVSLVVPTGERFSTIWHKRLKPAGWKTVKLGDEWVQLCPRHGEKIA
jgi:hypothetical protein